MTEWDEFKSLDYNKIYSTMTKPAFCFDGRGVIDLKKCQKIGFQTYGIGKPASQDVVDMEKTSLI